jgi:acetyl esterase/lipase
MTRIVDNRLIELIKWIRLVSAGLIFFYSILTIVDLPSSISMLWKLKAIEDGSIPILIAFVILILPKYQFNRIVLFSRLLALMGLILLLNPAWQANSLLKSLSKNNQSENESFSWKQYFLSSSSKCSIKKFIIPADNGEALESILCLPDNVNTKKPCILVLHGGGFTTGAAIHGLELTKALASIGYVCLSLEYRLAPKTQFPGQLNDINSAWSRLKRSDFAAKFDTNAFFLIGESAGASIALNYAQFVENKQLKGVVNLYGITDFTLNTTISDENKSELKEMINAYCGDNSASAISPNNTSLPINVPVLSIHGEKDDVVTFEQAVEFYKLRESQNLASELVILPWAVHLFNHPASGPSGQVTSRIVKRFIESNY